MLEKKVIKDTFVKWVDNQINQITSNNVFLNYLRPIIDIQKNKYINKVDKFLEMLSDDNGMIDIEGIIDKEIDLLLVNKPATINGLTLGDGKIKYNIPFINQELVLDSNDLNELKQLLVSAKK